MFGWPYLLLSYVKSVRHFFEHSFMDRAGFPNYESAVHHQILMKNTQY